MKGVLGNVSFNKSESSLGFVVGVISKGVKFVGCWLLALSFWQFGFGNVYTTSKRRTANSEWRIANNEQHFI